MNIKGEIGREVLIKAKIRGISIDENGIEYMVNCKEGEDLIPVKESDIYFDIPEKEPKKTRKKMEIPEEKKKTTMETPEAPKKRPGRPKKSTVQDTLDKLEELRRMRGDE